VLLQIDSAYESTGHEIVPQSNFKQILSGQYAN